MSRLLLAIPAAVWMGLIYYASSFPGSATGPNTPPWVFFLKTLHFMNFGVLALLLLAVVKGNRSLAEIRLRAFGICLVLTVLFAMSDEYHQKFTPGRHPSAGDVMIDGAGASTFLAACLVLRSKKRNREDSDV